MVVFLGYAIGREPPNDLETLVSKFPRFTYRQDFPPLPNGARTDRRWGCCIRCGQTLVAHFLRKYAGTMPERYSQFFPGGMGYYSCFFDLPGAPFGIHAFCREISELGGKIGQWVKPSLIGAVIRRLFIPLHVKVVVAEGNLVSRRYVKECLEAGGPVLLLLPMMLGLDHLEMRYWPFVKVALSLLVQSLGIIGGHNGKSYYLVGHHNDEVLYFDPHKTMAAVTTIDDVSQLYEGKMKRMKVQALNPSMLVGLFISSMTMLEEIPMVSEPLGDCPWSIVDSVDAIGDF